MNVKKLEAAARAVMAEHADEIARIQADLGNCEVPAQRSINAGFARMGINRFPAGKDDLWEMITDLQNGWEYERPPVRLIDRWMRY